MSDSISTQACPNCGRPVADDARFCSACGQGRYAPPTAPTHPVTPRVEEGDATGGVIPYKNVAALFAYYCGVFSIIPFFPIGIVAFILGIKGLKNRRENPKVRGAAHAWIGIIAGGLFGLLWLAITIMMIASAVAGP